MNEKSTFEPVYFETLKKAEERYFWFTVRRKWIHDRIRKFIMPPGRVLEIGCGSGNISSFLSRKGYKVTGCEFYPQALDISWPGFQKVRGNAVNLPFDDNSFAVVGLFDIIEHLDDDISPLREALRVVNEDGIVIVTVPAGKELWSWGDEISLHKRRYTKESCRKIILEAGLDPLLIEHMFMSLYLPMQYSRGKAGKKEVQFRINRIVNTLLKGFFDIERYISKVLPLPFGTSIIALARKKVHS
jgi:SAM-dependent methyltransferase